MEVYEDQQSDPTEPALPLVSAPQDETIYYSKQDTPAGLGAPTVPIKNDASCPVPGSEACGGVSELLRGPVAAVSTNATRNVNQKQQFSPNQAASLTGEKKFQSEVKRWEEFYDQMHSYLNQNTSINSSHRIPKNISKAAPNFSMGQDGTMFYSKLNKDRTGVIRIVVIRNYAERIEICKNIHVDTGNVSLHNRRDKMLEMVGCKYYWKGQRRDICQCVSVHSCLSSL